MLVRDESALARAPRLHGRGLAHLLLVAVRHDERARGRKALALECLGETQHAVDGFLRGRGHLEQLDKSSRLVHESGVVLAAANVDLLRHGARESL